MFGNSLRTSYVSIARGEIGSWEMDTEEIKEVTLSNMITGVNAISGVMVTILSDTTTINYEFTRHGEIEYTPGSGNPKLKLTRFSGGLFDNPIFSNSGPGYNRGYWTIIY